MLSGRRALALGLVCVALALGGCATSSGDRPPAARQHDVGHWELEGPFPARVALERYAPRDGFERELARVAARSGGQLVVTRAQHCAATELARFFLAHQAVPSQTLTVFTGTRCGSVSASWLPRLIHASVPESMTDDEVLAQWGPAVTELAESAIGPSPRSAGLVFRRQGDRAVVMLVSGELRADLEPAVPRPDATGQVHLKGTLRTSAASLHAVATQGRYGYADCEVSPTELLPRFTVSCPAAVGDAFTLVQLSVLPPGRVLGRSVLSFQARRDDGAIYHPYRYVDSVPVSLTETPRQLLDATNRVRRDAGLRPVSLDTTQSIAAGDETDPFFAAQAAGDGGRSDDIAVELIGGRRVEGMVSRGYFIAMSVAPEVDVGAWTSYALYGAGARQVLLNPDVERVAFGTSVASDGERMDVIALGYQVFDDSEPEANAKRVLERLTVLRAERAKPAPRMLGALEQKARESENLMRANRAPRKIMDEMLDESANRINRPVGAYWYEVTDVEQLPFHEELLDKRDLEIAISAAPRRPLDDYPWARLGVLVIVADPPVAGGR